MDKVQSYRIVSPMITIYIFYGARVCVDLYDNNIYILWGTSLCGSGLLTNIKFNYLVQWFIMNSPFFFEN